MACFVSEFLQELLYGDNCSVRKKPYVQKSVYIGIDSGV